MIVVIFFGMGWGLLSFLLSLIESEIQRMIPDDYVIIMEALGTVNSTLYDIAKYATKPKNQITTFEDCARVEKEINDALSGVQPFEKE